jgi:coproporphyrinogen III oxidase-like Fe-S oxidoreductase
LFFAISSIPGAANQSIPPANTARYCKEHGVQYRGQRCYEHSIEIDPRVTTLDHLVTLRRLGFNRLSMGIKEAL